MKTANAVIGMAAASILGGVLGGFLVRHMFKQYLGDAREEVEEVIDDAKKQTAAVSEQIETAVRFVYDNEAKAAFERKLRTINLEEMSYNICKDSIRKLDETMLRKLIRDTYDSQIKSVMREELKKYFEEGIKRFIDADIDSEFIRKTAKNYIRDEAEDKLSDEIDKIIKNYDVTRMIERAIDRMNLEKRIDKIVDNFDCSDLFEESVDDVDFEYLAEKAIREAVDDLDLEELAKNVIEEAVVEDAN